MRATRPARPRPPQALVDVAGIRRQLLRFGWVKDARVSRRLPDTLVIDIVERAPSALWQNQGQLALIDKEGVVLDRVPVDKMPDLPLLIGPGANGQAEQSGRLMDAVPTLKPQLASATWVGGRRWDLNFQSGETVALPEGDGDAAQGARANLPGSTNRPACSGAAWSASIFEFPARWSSRLPRAPGEPIAPAAAGGLARGVPAPDQPLVAALDIGSSKVSAMIARADDEGRLTVLGTGQRESRGVKRGYVTDMAASEFAVREAVELAERMSGVTVEEVWASYGAGGLVSDVANVEVELGGHAVEQSDIDELLSGGQNAIDRNGQVVLHAHPALYTIDRAQGVQKPIGLHANRLGVDIHVIAADPSPLRNIDTVIRSAHLGVKAIVASPIAAALACLNEEERELGVALVELGAEVTNVSVHYGGMLVGLRSIPLRRARHHQRHRRARSRFSAATPSA